MGCGQLKERKGRLHWCMYLREPGVAVCDGTQGHVAVQEQQGDIELGPEGKTEALALGLAIGHVQILSGVVLDRLVGGADVLDQRVL